MIKTLIALTLIGTIFFISFGYSEVFQIIMLVKWYYIFLWGIVLSKFAIFMVNMEIVNLVVRKLLKSI